ncbi:hypothetical protein B0H14DRAFT_3148674 [Mycena olivaceomarginata]|nr:hypothetical protein B0H14DRAFT_3148674 [Mycena olivaceomarginata]
MATTALLVALGYTPPPPTLSRAPNAYVTSSLSTPATVLMFAATSRFSTRFRAADIAFLATGASSDGKHIPPTGGFHPDFDEFYAATPEDGNAMRKAFRSELETLLHDLATVWDRTTGGTTVILHADGTVAPQTKIVPECLRASVYIPPLHFPPSTGISMSRTMKISAPMDCVPKPWHPVLQHTIDRIEPRKSSRRPLCNLPCRLSPIPPSLALHVNVNVSQHLRLTPQPIFGGAHCTRS